MTSSAKRARERAQHEARVLEEIERLDAEAAGVPRETSTTALAADQLAEFRLALAALVDELVGALEPPDRDAIATRLDAGDATLRLACDVAPRFRVALYLAIADPDPRYVTIASYPAPSPTTGGPVH